MFRHVDVVCFVMLMLCVCVCCTPSCNSEPGVLCSLLMFVSDASGDHMVEMYSSMGLVIALYVVSIVSCCFPHVVDVSVLCINVVLRACVVYMFVVFEFGLYSDY